MNKLLFVLVFFVNSFGFSLSGEALSITRYTADCIINNHYTEAISTLDAVTDTTGDPLYAVLKLAAIGMRDVDFEKIIDSTLFLTTFNQAQLQIEAYRSPDDHSSDAYLQTLLGMTKAIHAAFYMKQKKYFAAMSNGFDAIDLMKKAQKLDTLNYEVDFFLGLYEFIRSELRSKLWWVLFWYPGDREEGVRRVERCAQSAIITRNAARISLCDMYQQDKLYNKAQDMVTDLKKTFPESRFVLWAEVKLNESLKKFENAAQIYSTLSKSYQNETHGEYNALFTRTQQAKMLFKSGDTVSAKTICTAMLERPELNHHRALKKVVKKIKEHCK